MASTNTTSLFRCIFFFNILTSIKIIRFKFEKIYNITSEKSDRLCFILNKSSCQEYVRVCCYRYINVKIRTILTYIWTKNSKNYFKFSNPYQNNNLNKNCTFKTPENILLHDTICFDGKKNMTNTLKLELNHKKHLEKPPKKHLKS